MQVKVPKIIEERRDKEDQLENSESLSGRFSPFFAKFPELAASENKTLELVFADQSIPKAEYLLIENYCDDNTCDCRKVMINIIDKKDPSKILATIGFGWESLDFYKQWTHGEEWLAKEMQGAFVEIGGIQSEESAYLLEEFEKSIDDNYVEDIKRHYLMFKNLCLQES